MKLNKKNIIITMLMVIFLLSCRKENKNEVKENLRPVKVQKLEKNEISLGYATSGEIKGIEEIEYRAAISGTVSMVNAKNGDVVNNGQLIVAIDNQSGISNLASANVVYNQAKINFRKYNELYEKGLITETEYLNAKTNLETSKANFEIANDIKGKSNIFANKRGVISNLKLEKYEQVNVGDSLFTLINDEEMSIEVGVSPKVIDKIKLGSTATIKIDELKNEEIEGKVYEVGANSSKSTRQFTVKIKIDNSERKIKSGMYGIVNINTGKEEGLIVPKKSIVVKGVQQVVYILKGDKVTMIPITIVNQNEEYAAVLGEGLEIGSQLVIDGQNIIQNNDKVRVIEGSI